MDFCISDLKSELMLLRILHLGFNVFCAIFEYTGLFN